MKYLLVAVALLSGCATLTEDETTPMAFAFSDGKSGTCKFENKRGMWNEDVPTTVNIRRSDDSLRYECVTEDGNESMGLIPSTIGMKFLASVFLLDLGITDSITDKHRQYPASFVMPVMKK
jgi:hypothetical protein